jgi:predicted transcriptional regulator
MLTAEQINTIHRLHWSEHWSVRKIARHLHLGRRTISQYLVTPARSAARRQRASKLDPFKATIAELLEQDAKASAVVIAQRLRPLGFDGGLSILKDYLHAVRAHTAVQRAYVRMEPGPGERFEIDWGHFGALLYQGTRASSMPSVWSNVIAANCLWSSRTAKTSRLSCAVTSTLSSSWAGSHENSGMTISPPLSPNMMAT